MWKFNRSEEDYIIRMKNRLQACRAEQAKLMKMIPEHEDRLSKLKDKLAEDGNESKPYRDSFSPRREPLRLEMDLKKPKKKDNKPPTPKPLFEIRSPS
jgi:hypothetical protein